MKGIYFTIYSCCFSIICFAQPAEKINQTDAQGQKHGFWKKTDEAGLPKYEGSFIHGKPFGKFVYYFPEGKPKAESIYSAGGNHCVTIMYYETGVKRAEGNYIQEKKDSCWTFYDEKGRLNAHTWYKNNKREGKSFIYYESGKIFEESMWLADIKNGPQVQYFENGKKKEEGVIKDGHFEGKVIRYHPNGEKCAMGDYVGGKQAGDWCYYDENGFPTFKETIKKGESINRKYYFGTFEENYPDEIPKSKISYKNGKKHGPFIEYYHKGTYKLVPQKNDDGSEDLTRVLTGTQIKVQGSYFEDRLDGEILHYSEDGKLNKKEFYDKGNLLKQK